MKIGLIIIATGEVYRNYAKGLIESIKTHFSEAEPVVFSDDESGNFLVSNLGYPKSTLYRYHMMISQEKVLSKFEQLFYVDADMQFVSKPGDIYSPGLTATLHPGFYKRGRGTPEMRKESTAYCPNNTVYYCGGFQGGEAGTYLEAAREIKNKIDKDDENNILAIWHDESHWNKYLVDKPPSNILTPAYCYPEDYNGGYGWKPKEFNPVLIALDKCKRGNHPRFL